MIEKKTVCQIVDEWLEGKDYFLVEVTVSPDDKIVVEIDHAEGVWIEDCVELSRYIESKLNREEEDYELEVGSAGIGQPFKVLQQYYIHIGQEVEVVTRDGRKLAGILKDADEEKFTVGVQKKVKLEGSKRPKLIEEDETFTLCNFKDIGSFKKACYYLILAPNDLTNLIFLPFAMIGFFHSPPKIRITAFLPTGTASTAFCKSMKLPRPSAETT